LEAKSEKSEKHGRFENQFTVKGIDQTVHKPQEKVRTKQKGT